MRGIMYSFALWGGNVRLVDRLKSWLRAARPPLRLTVLGFVLGAPSLGVGLFMDDIGHRSAFLGVGEMADVVRSPVRMFSFSGGIPKHTRPVIDHWRDAYLLRGLETYSSVDDVDCFTTKTPKDHIVRFLVS